MAKVGFYVSPEEQEWIKRQGPGWFRAVVKHAMAGEPHEQAAANAIAAQREQNEVLTKKTVRGVPIPTGGEPPSPRRVQNACRFCGGVTMAGKCMACKAVQ